MDQPTPTDLQSELASPRRRLSEFERMVDDLPPAATARHVEIDLNAVVSELTYSLITANASLAGIADIVRYRRSSAANCTGRFPWPTQSTFFAATSGPSWD